MTNHRAGDFPESSVVWEFQVSYYNWKEVPVTHLHPLSVVRGGERSLHIHDGQFNLRRVSGLNSARFLYLAHRYGLFLFKFPIFKCQDQSESYILPLLRFRPTVCKKFPLDGKKQRKNDMKKSRLQHPKYHSIFMLTRWLGYSSSSSDSR